MKNESYSYDRHTPVRQVESSTPLKRGVQKFNSPLEKGVRRTGCILKVIRYLNIHEKLLCFSSPFVKILSLYNFLVIPVTMCFETNLKIINRDRI